MSLLIVIAPLLPACQKAELFDTSTPKIVEIAFSGSSSIPLEIIYDETVVDSTRGEFNTMPNPFKLNIAKGGENISVRQKGKTAILKSYNINAENFKQPFGIFYDNGKIYDSGIKYKLEILAKNSGLDFYLDNQIIYQNPYEGTTLETLTIPVNKEQKRSLAVKKKGEKEILLTKIITAADTSKTLKFYLEGNDLVENLTIPALKNPRGMSVTFKLLTNVNAIETKFIGGDVDLVAYIRNLNTTDVKKPNPELRFTTPANQSFVTMELPPLAESEYYTFDIVKKGTNESAFVSNNSMKKVNLGFGNYGSFYFFNPDFMLFLPGERIICTIMPAEETGGANYDEIFVTPTINEYLTNWINFQ